MKNGKAAAKESERWRESVSGKERQRKINGEEKKRERNGEAVNVEGEDETSPDEKIKYECIRGREREKQKPPTAQPADLPANKL